MSIDGAGGSTLLLARMAEAMYWAGRYYERAEGMARIVQVHADAFVDLPYGADVGWGPLLDIAGLDASVLPAGVTEAEVVRHLLVEPANPTSVLSSLARARSDVSTARAIVPREAWEACNALWLAADDRRRSVTTREGRVRWVQGVIAGCRQLAGSLAGVLRHDEAYSFWLLGAGIERADLTTRVLDVQAASLKPHDRTGAYEEIHWMAALRSLAAYQPYRRAMPRRAQADSTLRFLLQDDRFPRSVAACLAEIRSHVKGLDGNADVLEACTDVAVIVADAAVERLVSGGLHELVDTIQIGLAGIHGELERWYFRPTSVPPDPVGRPVRSSAW